MQFVVDEPKDVCAHCYCASLVILSIILKNKKNLCVGSFNYFLYTIQIGSNWYMDTGVRDLEVACF